ncbi:ArsB/NhaD family transporter [Aneurinibacillus aneurinilyticus]|jgi:Na+/H+ antiporter NhaD/arsenite permease-like protein|uniref:ArsB/NhaD family transporter n=2 Tax=Aneurinibacillus aneurinilyticus TaxID=1391 RepID=A0A848CXS2_ANEAE|nr:ArsB/NhaD family transporter [Aneurinibacillus aneurinilyticus]ERI06162.1 citrate transporter [Aneurinibacillus aneurinilyticus ATCC 12856]MCI1695980.1 ArsB/NhaD family transporter [Aneurinibacillus aneurinilyticus]MED0669585.1 ArsB/NhaD family transporter [Aneurinibacillus aneurinilyticus]MED0709124.1 ArsB/NhaD family transporter [Aneurinibacillus aneurinilyticus]MED0724853.1 ArsB/NhaD family transporter [Aneurinibacillus aneurinilyticus]
MEQQAIYAIIIFLITYALIISEKIHRTIVAMLGAALMIAFGIVNQETALHHIDFNTLGLLTGMMIIVTVTAQTGLFKYIAIWAAKKAKGDPIRILVALGLITAFASAFLDNVTTVLLMVPVTFSITRQLRVSPMPYLLTQILTSNIGGTATLIGDPPNIMIGSAVKELTFAAFIFNLAPIIIVILAVTVGILAFWYRKQLKTTPELQQELMQMSAEDELSDPTLLKKCLFILALTIAGFFAHQALHIESATVALTGAFLLLLLTGEHYLEDALTRVEWTTIFFFVGLFVLVSGLVETGVIAKLAQEAITLTGGDLTATAMLILWMSAIASAFVDNIPFVATMIPMIQEMGKIGLTDLEPLWWSLALGACLGGNGTLIGASANVIVAGMAGKEGHHISFVKFLFIGFPLMILSIIISTVYVYLRYLM